MRSVYTKKSQTILEDEEAGKVPRQDDEEVRLPV